MAATTDLVKGRSNSRARSSFALFNLSSPRGVSSDRVAFGMPLAKRREGSHKKEDADAQLDQHKAGKKQMK
eukprot:4695436-Pleurochrysis_carterae.AAC.1